MKLRVATSQFPTSAKVEKNLEYVVRQMHSAKERGGEVVHFPEACLSGYVPHDLKSYAGFDWAELRSAAGQVLELAKELRLWVVLGSAHPLSGRHRPHNSLYIINARGKLVDRYDKMFCAGDKGCCTGDLAHYSPGHHFSVFEIKGIKCGALICHEYRYPELYREYKRRGVELIFHSYHAGNLSRSCYQAMKKQVGKHYHRLNKGSTLPEITMPASMQAAAASSHIWFSCSNSSARESCWPGFFVRPDGVITGRLRRNVSGILISTVDTKADVYDSTRAWRDRALNGIYHSGKLGQDKRSHERTKL